MKQETFTHPSVWLAHRISYGETDAMGIVYYAESRERETPLSVSPA